MPVGASAKLYSSDVLDIKNENKSKLKANTQREHFVFVSFSFGVFFIICTG